MALERDPDAVYNLNGEIITVADNVAGWRVHQTVGRGSKIRIGRPVVAIDEPGPLYVERGEESADVLVRDGGCAPGAYALVPVDDKFRTLDGEIALLTVPASMALAPPVSPSDEALRAELRELRTVVKDVIKDTLDAATKQNAQLATALAELGAAVAQQFKPVEHRNGNGKVIDATATVTKEKDGDDDEGNQVDWAAIIEKGAPHLLPLIQMFAAKFLGPAPGAAAAAAATAPPNPTTPTV